MYKDRILEKKLPDYAKNFKIVLVLGARQVGKSTLLEHQFPNLKKFVFNPLHDEYNVSKDPEFFLDSFPGPLILDEIQYRPELLPFLKIRVDTSEKKGQYFLTGSQNILLLQTVSESLAGRVGILELDGLIPKEMESKAKEPSWLEHYFEDTSSLFSRQNVLCSHHTNLPRFLWRGTLPALLPLEDHMVHPYLQSYVQTYLERDIRVSGNIQNFDDFYRFLRLVAACTAQEMNSSQIGREIGISPHTAKKWLSLLSRSFQWLELPPYEGNTIKRISGKKKGYFRDTGLIGYLLRISSPEALFTHPLFGAFFETYAVNWILRETKPLATPPYAYHFRSHAGAEVDLVLERNGFLYPIEVKAKTHLSLHDTSGIKAFRETFPKKTIKPALIIYAGKDVHIVDKDIIAIPWNLL